MKINHVSVNMLEEFIEEKVNKLSIFFGNHLA